VASAKVRFINALNNNNNLEQSTRKDDEAKRLCTQVTFSDLLNMSVGDLATISPFAVMESRKIRHCSQQAAVITVLVCHMLYRGRVLISAGYAPMPKAMRQHPSCSNYGQMLTKFFKLDSAVCL